LLEKPGFIDHQHCVLVRKMLGGIIAHQVAQCIGIPPVTAQNRLLPPRPRIARCLRAHPSGFTTLVAKQPVHEQARVQSCALLREQWTYPLLHLSQRRCPQLTRRLNRCSDHP
jgi:hypothetical protein